MTIRSANAIDIHVGRRIRAARLAAGLSQEKLADALGVTFQQVQKYEKGTNRIGAGRLHDIALALNVPVAHFFEHVAHERISSDAAIDQITEALSTTEGIRIAQALARIEDKDLRRRIADLLEAMVVHERRRAVA